APAVLGRGGGGAPGALVCARAGAARARAGDAAPRGAPLAQPRPGRAGFDLPRRVARCAGVGRGAAGRGGGGARGRDARPQGPRGVEAEAAPAAPAARRRGGLEGWAVESDDGVTVALDTALDDELRLEARVLDRIHTLNSMRKEQGLELTDRIVVTLPPSDEDLLEHADWIKNEVLAVELRLDG